MTLTKKTVFVIVLLISINTFTQEIVTDRPDQTESSVTVGKNNFQIESGLSFLNKSNNSETSFFGPSTLMRYGISNGIELRLMSQYESTKFKQVDGNNNFSGLNDLEIGYKIQLLQSENINTKIAFLSHVIVPTGNDEVTTNSFGVINKLSISNEISDQIGIGYNVGYDNIAKEHFLTYSVAIGISLSKVVGLYVETYGAWGETGFFESNFDTGFTFLINNNSQLDASYGVGLNNNMHYISTGFSWKIPNFLMKTKS